MASVPAGSSSDRVGVALRKAEELGGAPGSCLAQPPAVSPPSTAWGWEGILVEQPAGGHPQPWTLPGPQTWRGAGPHSTPPSGTPHPRVPRSQLLIGRVSAHQKAPFLLLQRVGCLCWSPGHHPDPFPPKPPPRLLTQDRGLTAPAHPVLTAVLAERYPESRPPQSWDVTSSEDRAVAGVPRPGSLRGEGSGHRAEATGGGHQPRHLADGHGHSSWKGLPRRPSSLQRVHLHPVVGTSTAGPSALGFQPPRSSPPVPTAAMTLRAQRSAMPSGPLVARAWVHDDKTGHAEVGAGGRQGG